jgi:hypothetical protein
MATAEIPNPAAPQPQAPGLAFAPMVQGESSYDRVTSLLMSVVIGVAFVVGFLWLIYLTNRAYATRVTAPLEIIEVVGGSGGGTPEGVVGETGGAVEVPGGEAGDFASNAEELEGLDFEEPSMQQISSTVLDLSSPVTEGLSEMDIGAATPTGGLVATGRRMSKVGTGRAGFGLGGSGDGGVRREDRWSIVYNPGQTLDEYARQLDAFGVEIGVIQNNAMLYVSGFSSGTPRTRFGPHAADGRLFFVWQSNTRKASDIDLLRQAGVAVGDSPIFHFYPRPIEDQLAQLEVRFRGRQPIEIKSTRFSVVSRGGSYGFAVLSQDPLIR